MRLPFESWGIDKRWMITTTQILTKSIGKKRNKKQENCGRVNGGNENAPRGSAITAARHFPPQI